MKNLSKIISAALVGLVLASSFVFGPQIAINAHRAFLRYKMSNVVMLTAFTGGGGTGFFIRKDGSLIIITNAHVCRLANESGYMMVDGKGLAKVLKVYDKQDLCALLPDSGFSASGLGIASSVEHGEQVFTLGHPLLQPSTISVGELSGPYQIMLTWGYNVDPDTCKGETYRLLDKPEELGMAAIFGIKNICLRMFESESSPVIILPGNSGSPTTNIYGNVVAVAHAANEYGTRSFHVPLKDLKDFVNSL